MKAMIKFLFHLSESKSPYIRAALVSSMVLADNGVNTWFNKLTRILKFCNLDYLLFTSDSNEINYQVNNVETKLKQIYNNKWSEERSSFSVDSKLDLFVSIKDKFGISDYLLSSINPSYRSAIAKIRLSAHKFPIETERYIKTPRKDRICPLGCQALGDELHYLFDCSHPCISMVHLPLHASLKLIYPHIDDMDAVEKGKLLLNSTCPSTLNITGKLCHKVQSVFKEITW
jgi:hypothetical protein